MVDFSDEELLTVISDFLEKGLAENIIAMFKKEPELHRLTGKLLKDERFMVRMGVAILYEELVNARPEEVASAMLGSDPGLDSAHLLRTGLVLGEWNPARDREESFLNA